VKAILFKSALLQSIKQCLAIRASKMKHLLHVDQIIHDLGLSHVSGDSVQYERVDVGLELMSIYRRIDRLSPKFHGDIVRNELAFARILKEGFADFCARCDRAEYVATCAMIVARDRAEGFALRAFAAARRAKQEKSLVFHHDEIAYTVNAASSTSSVIPSEVEGPRGVTQRVSTGSFNPESFRGSDDEDPTAGSTFPRRPPRSKRTLPLTRAKIV